mmetsp:Transcript_81129/g.262849  ORF Transcript_81129/g.262849 Transcript_81129/m.262849 type:complete len:293 (+) Transcript_81129:878-1756(+)
MGADPMTSASRGTRLERVQRNHFVEARQAEFAPSESVHLASHEGRRVPFATAPGGAAAALQGPTQLHEVQAPDVAKANRLLLGDIATACHDDGAPVADCGVRRAGHRKGRGDVQPGPVQGVQVVHVHIVERHSLNSVAAEEHQLPVHQRQRVALARFWKLARRRRPRPHGSHGRRRQSRDAGGGRVGTEAAALLPEGCAEDPRVVQEATLEVVAAEDEHTPLAVDRRGVIRPSTRVDSTRGWVLLCSRPTLLHKIQHIDAAKGFLAVRTAVDVNLGTHKVCCVASPCFWPIA